MKEIIRRAKEKRRDRIISEYPCIDFLHNALHFLKSEKPEVAYSEICHAIIRSGAELNREEKEEFKRIKDRRESRMSDKEKLEKVYDFVKSQEDYFYKPIEDGKHEPGSIAAMQCVFQASSFQKVRYFIENLMEESEE